MLAYRSSSHSSTKVSPNKMVYGREVVLPMAAIIGRPKSESDNNNSIDSYIRDLSEKIRETHDVARENIGKASEYQRPLYDTNAKLKRYKVGQCVWLHDPTRRKGVCSKLISK